MIADIPNGVKAYVPTIECHCGADVSIETSNWALGTPRLIKEVCEVGHVREFGVYLVLVVEEQK